MLGRMGNGTIEVWSRKRRLIEEAIVQISGLGQRHSGQRPRTVGIWEGSLVLVIQGGIQMTASALPSLFVPFFLFHPCCILPLPHHSLHTPIYSIPDHIYKVETEMYDCLRGASWGREDKTISVDVLPGS